MKATLNINQLARRRGLTTAYRLQRAADLSPSNAARLFNGRSTMLSLETIGKLCDVLGCSPGDLFDVQGGTRKPRHALGG